MTNMFRNAHGTEGCLTIGAHGLQPIQILWISDIKMSGQNKTHKYHSDTVLVQGFIVYIV